MRVASNVLVWSGTPRVCVMSVGLQLMVCVYALFFFFCFCVLCLAHCSARSTPHALALTQPLVAGHRPLKQAVD